MKHVNTEIGIAIVQSHCKDKWMNGEPHNNIRLWQIKSGQKPWNIHEMEENVSSGERRIEQLQNLYNILGL